MKRVKRRSIAVFALVGVLVLGLLFYIVKLAVKGGDWVGFPGNRGVYSAGVLDVGMLYDRNGKLLAWAGDGLYGYAEDWSTRVSTLHASGDYSGNIGTGAISAFADKLIGYNIISGTYSLDGKGDSLRLTIDSDLNVTAYSALGGRKGTVAVYNYKTGEVLCMVSTPSYDPANPPDIQEGDSAYEGVYLNRFLSSTYTPGSVFKLVTAVAALETVSDIDTLKFTCEGYYDADGDHITCLGTHGTIDLEEALAHSCNSYFAQLSLLIGPDTISEYADRMGLLDSVSVNGIIAAKGSFTIAETDADIAWSGIGQHEDLVNPCSMLRLMGAVANGGTPYNPRLIMRTTTTSGFPTGLYFGRKGARLLDADTAGALKEMMRNNVVSNYGEWNFPGLNICAKSGTAEVGGGAAAHSWFVGFLDDPDNPLAFVVVVENGGSGIAAAGSVANTVLQAAVS